MSHHIIVEWSVDRVAVLCADSGLGSLTATFFGSLETPDHADPQVSVEEAAAPIRQWLTAHNVGEGAAQVVLARELIMIRRLELPQAPEDELPDMVRFQAATKTSTPINDLALDFLTLRPTSETAEQHVVIVTIERQKLARVQAVLKAAGLTVETVSISPLTAAQIVRRTVSQSVGTAVPSLIVFQHDSRVEISILDEGSLVFSHAMELPAGTGNARLRPLKTEITRSLVALEQLHPNVDVDHCYHLGTQDSDVLEFLGTQFGERFEAIPTSGVIKGVDLAGYESLVGAALPSDRRLMIDLLNPRKRVERPDRRRLYYSLAGAGVALILLLSYGVFLSKKNALEASIVGLEDRVFELDGQLRTGEPRTEAHAAISEWMQSKADSVEVWNEFRSLMPSTDRLYIKDIRIAPQSGDVIAKYTGVGYARRRSDVNDFNTKLRDHGFQVKPQAMKEAKYDPDFPIEFQLDIQLTRESTAPAASETPPPEQEETLARTDSSS